MVYKHNALSYMYCACVGMHGEVKSVRKEAGTREE